MFLSVDWVDQLPRAAIDFKCGVGAEAASAGEHEREARAGKQEHELAAARIDEEAVPDVLCQEGHDHVSGQRKAGQSGGEAYDQQPAADGLRDRHERRHQGRRGNVERGEVALGGPEVDELVDPVDQERRPDEEP